VFLRCAPRFRMSSISKFLHTIRVQVANLGGRTHCRPSATALVAKPAGPRLAASSSLAREEERGVTLTP
jgi:hypothetical protein